MSQGQKGAVLLLGGCFVFAIIVVAIASSGSGSSDHMSPATATFVDSAMPALAHVTSEIQAGDNAQAAMDWTAVGTIPVTNSADRYVATKFAAYQDDVRYYGVGDGSVNLEQLEAAQADAQNAILGLR